MRDRLGDRFVQGIVLYTGHLPYRIQDESKLTVLPIDSNGPPSLRRDRPRNLEEGGAETAPLTAWPRTTESDPPIPAAADNLAVGRTYPNGLAIDSSDPWLYLVQQRS
jgi:hypothetical protein